MNQKSSMNVGGESDGREVPAKDPEQRRQSVSGRLGGKATGQGEHRADDQVPDSELGSRVERPARCAGSSKKR
jgi:hypothetical protein